MRHSDAAQTVYVVEPGAYSDRYIAGVYATLESAMAAHPEGEWKQIGRSTWDNGLDLYGGVSIHAFTVQP